MASFTSPASIATRMRRRVLAITALILTTLAVAIGAAWTAPAHADTAQAPSTAKLTCRDFNGAGFINWDILVQLNPDGTARSAEQLGDAYLTGVQVVSVERTDEAAITITDGGRSLSFHGQAILQSGIPETSFNFSGPAQSCTADFSFPNPQTPFTNLTPTS
jgi:hypothetical protein